MQQRSNVEVIRTMERFIRRHSLMERGDTLLVAVSGGPDSTALLHILHQLSAKWEWKLTAAHLNHQFRGEESDLEAQLVARFCAELNIPCELGTVDMPDIIRHTGDNAQNAAREQRYAFLTQKAMETGANRLVTAHHADDQAETILMRIVRGTGPSGLTGIPLRRSLNDLELVRPLLRIYKSELVRYCTERKLTYAEDSSNRSRKYTRNRIRLDVMPALTAFNPQLAESLNRLADLMVEEDDFIDKEARRAWPLLVTGNENGCAFSRNAFTALHIALQRRLIQLILSYVCAEADASDFNRIERIREMIGQDAPPSAVIHLQEGAALRRDYDQITIVRHSLTDSTSVVETDLNGILDRSHILGQVAVRWAGAMTFSAQPWAGHGQSGDLLTFAAEETHVEARPRPSYLEAFFDFDHVHFPLTIRKRREGDRMQPLGLNGSKKVKDMFIDKKVPQWLREQTPIIEDASGHIIWIPGLGRSKHALLAPDTSQVMTIRFIPNE
jgi:tRNA(Ile)-lysidine synthase